MLFQHSLGFVSQYFFICFIKSFISQYMPFSEELLSNYLDFQKQLFTGDYNKFNEEIIRGDKARSNGVSAMSVSDMTGIPRATVIRKCKFLIKNDFLRLNEKKQYILTGFNVRRVLPYQKLIFKNKAKFIRKVLNLLTIS